MKSSIVTILETVAFIVIALFMVSICYCAERPFIFRSNASGKVWAGEKSAGGGGGDSVDYFDTAFVTMTASNAPSPYNVYADTTYDVYYPYYCFDNNRSTFWASAINTNPHQIVIYLGSPRTARSFFAYNYYHNFKDFTFDGSNNGADWTTLLNGTASDSERQVWLLTSYGSYSYYRLRATSYYSILMQMYALEISSAVWQSPVMTSATTPTGMVTADSYLESGLAPYLAMDRIKNVKSSRWQSDTVVYPHWIQYQPQTSMVINGFSYYGCYISGAERGFSNYFFQASQNGIDWTTLDSGVMASGVSENECKRTNATNNNTTAYAYYRLYSTVGYVNNQALVTDVEWKSYK